LTERGLGLIELGALIDRELVAGAVDVEVEHGHRGAIRIVAVPRGILGRFLERRGDLLGRTAGEQAGLEIERVIVGCDLCLPFLG